MIADTSRPARRIAPADWILAFLLMAAAAKLALVILCAADGGGQAWLRPLAVVAYLHEDVRMGAVFALITAAFAWLERRWAASRWGLVAIHALLTFWIAFNVPVARQLSSPMTYAFLHATGTALGDSIASYATPANLIVPAVLWLGGLALPHLLRGRWHPSRRTLLAAGAIAAAWLVAGPAAVARVDTLGLHRNAVLALVETTLARGSRADETFPPLEAPACRPQSEGADLRHLAGLARDRNIVWVILESVGARALGAYGAPPGRTPHLDALAAESLVFDGAYAAYPESIKGLYSILCARMPPPRSEASEYAADRLPCPAVAQELGRAGWRTGLFHSGWFAYLGMEAVVKERGFQRLEDAAVIDSPHRSSFGVDDRSTARRVLAFVDEKPAARFFAVFMPIAGHHPYRAPGDGPRPFPEASDGEAYVNDVHVADDSFGLLRAGLQARGLDQRTLYVVIGDHGEAFREHEGNVAHALFLYEENVRVPLLVAAPGQGGGQRRVPLLASLIDLTPTTLALAGVPVPPGYAGRSLLAGAPRVVRFFTEQGVRRAGLRDGRWKLIVDQDAGRTQLFDLANDPGEQRDLAGARPDLVSRYRPCLGP